MSPHQITAIGIRLFAIWLAIYALRTAPYFFAQTQKYNDGLAAGIAIAVLVLVVLLLLVLWFFPRSIAKGLLPTPVQSTLDVTSPDTWFAIGCSLLGLWVLSEAIPALVQYFIFLYLDRRSGDWPSLPPGWHAGAVSQVVHLLIGFWLLLGAKGIKRLLLWARHD